MKTAKSSRFVAHGISLIEMLITIAILGLIVSIALPSFGGGTEGIRQARDLRNAQTACSIFASAQVAGVDFSEGNPTIQEIMQRLVKGVVVEKGQLKGRSFALPNLGAEEIQSAVKYLAMVDGSLVYNSTSTVSRPDGEVAVSN